LISTNLLALLSTSKIPPQLANPRLQVGDGGGEEVEAFCFHGGDPSRRRAVYRA
jgi:hypothetical protein